MLSDLNALGNLKMLERAKSQKEFWSNIDWNVRNVDIEKKYDYDIAYISRMRKKYGTPSNVINAVRLYWSHVDWSKTTKELMFSTGYSRSHINLMRRKYGK